MRIVQIVSLFLIAAVFGCSDSDPRTETQADTTIDSAEPLHSADRRDSLSTRKFAGLYTYGANAEKEAVGTLFIYPETDSTVIFHLEIMKGPPSYNSGTATGSLLIAGDTATWSESAAAECKLRFRFTDSSAVIETIEDENCGFGGNVAADHTYTHTDHSIPEYFINPEGDTSRFDHIASLPGNL